jgi:hypothetical protein
MITLDDTAMVLSIFLLALHRNKEIKTETHMTGIIIFVKKKLIPNDIGYAYVEVLYFDVA